MSVAVLRWRLVSVLALFTLVIGCGGGGGDGGTTPSGGNPTIAISLSASSVAVTQGASGTVTVTLTRAGGFTGDVTLSVSGAPAGVTVGGATIPSGQSSATLTINAAATAAAGTNTLTVQASGSGVAATSATLSLVVNAAQVAGSITLSATPATLSVQQGASGNVTVNINRTNFTGAVNLAVSGAPANVTSTLSAASVTGNTATLTLNPAIAAAVGNSTLTITASGSGISNATTTVTLSVTAAQASGGNTAFKFCGKSGIPLWVAAQDGTGNWTRVTGTSDTYSFNITSKGGIAYVVNGANGGFDLDVIYGTSAELQQISTNLCNDITGAGKTVTAAITNAAAADLVQASLGPVAGTITGNTSASFAGVPSGNVDLLASKAAVSFNGASVSFALQKMILRRGLNPAAGSALTAIDFNGSEAFAPVTKNLTVNNLNGELTALVMGYLTANNYAVGAYFVDANISGGARTFPGVPSGSQAAGDLHMLTLSAVPSLQNTTQTRNVLVFFKDAVDKTITLGPAMTAPAVASLTAAGYGRTRASITLQPEYNRHLAFDVQQTGSTARRTYIQMTSGYHAGANPVIDIPDFSGVAGFDTNWGLKVGTQATWTVTATGWTGGSAGQPPFTDGAAYLSGTRMGNVTP